LVCQKCFNEVRFAEVFLRLGCAMVAWMLIYAHVLWLAALHSMSCGPDGDDLHRLLLGLLPLTLGSAYLLRVTRPFPDIHSILRWLGVPLALLSPVAILSIWDVFVRTNVNSLSICSNDTVATWQQLWAPAQLSIVILVAYMILRMLNVTGQKKR
jgi:hypothetical protein